MTARSMRQWKTTALGDVTRIESGAGFPTDDQGSIGGRFPFYKVSDMNLPGNEVWMHRHNNAIDEETRSRLKAQAHPPGTVIFPKIGAAIATNKKRILTKESCFDNNVIGIHPSAELDSSFLYHLLLIKDLSDFANTGNPPSIRKTTLEAWTISLPPITEQRRIARILDTADELRSKRRKALVELDALIQSVFLDLFGDPGLNSKRWSEHTLGSLSTGFRNGLSPSEKGGVDGRVLTLSAITRGGFDFLAQKAARFDKTPERSQLISKDTFLVCRGNGNKALVGAGLFPDRDSSDVCFPDTIIGVEIDLRRMRKPFLETLWCSSPVRRQIEAGARTTNGTYKINQQVLSSIALPVPPIELQDRFAVLFESLREQKARQSQHLAELDALFASLQMRAFKGEL